MGDDGEEINYGRRNEKITNKKWEYEEEEVIIWRRCTQIQYSSPKI